MAGKTEFRRQEIESRLTALEQSESDAKTKLGDIQKWVRLIKENSTALDATRELLETLIERVEVSESRTENGEKMQDVRIVYKFIGSV